MGMVIGMEVEVGELFIILAGILLVFDFVPKRKSVRGRSNDKLR